MKNEQNTKNTEEQNIELQQSEDLLGTTVNNHSLVEGEVEITEVNETPFVVAGNGENYFVMCSKYRVSQVFDSKEKALSDAHKITWARIMQVLTILKEV